MVPNASITLGSLHSKALSQEALRALSNLSRQGFVPPVRPQASHGVCPEGLAQRRGPRSERKAVLGPLLELGFVNPLNR